MNIQTMTIIKQDDLIQSVANALQFISYYHPMDFITALNDAYEREENPAAKDAMAQILVNSRMAAEGKRPLCQDTGIVTVFVTIGMNVQWHPSTTMGVEDMVNEGVRQAYMDLDNPLRASILSDPAGARKNTGDNTPAVVYFNSVPGDTVEITLAAKGGGSEAKSRFAMLNPSDDVVEWVLEQVPKMGAGWCPPGILGIGIGGTADKAMRLAKEACMETIDIHDLKAKGAESTTEKLRLELFDKVNRLGIGAQGLGGLTTVLDVKIRDFPTHAVNKAVAIIPNCAATRHVHFTLDGSGVAELDAPTLDQWPEVTWGASDSVKRVNLDNITSEEVQSWRSGDTLMVSGSIYTGRDAAHKRIQTMLANGEELPVNLRNKFIYYVGPVDAVRDEAVGPAGPTTSTRMDKFSDMMLSEVGLAGMIGKAERGPVAVESIRKHKAAYLIAVGGAAYLVSKAIRQSRKIAFEDLGMEAIHEFIVEDMPVTVAVDSRGDSVHESGPREWKKRIEAVSVEVQVSR
jgi:fumarate hydratase class I